MIFQILWVLCSLRWTIYLGPFSSVDAWTLLLASTLPYLLFWCTQYFLPFLLLQILLIVFSLLEVFSLLLPFNLCQAKSTTSCLLRANSRNTSSTISPHLPQPSTSFLLGHPWVLVSSFRCHWDALESRHLCMSLSSTRLKTHWWWDCEFLVPPAPALCLAQSKILIINCWMEMNKSGWWWRGNSRHIMRFSWENQACVATDHLKNIKYLKKENPKHLR